MNETKKNTGLKLVVVALVIALCIAYVKIRNLESIICNLRSDMNTSVSMLEDRVNSIYSNVDAFLKEEASLLSSVSAEYGELNLEDHTIGVTVTLIPKLISDDMKVQLSINGRNTELTRNGNSFSGLIPVDIYNLGEQLLMTIDTEAGTQTQYLSEVRTEYLWEDKVPSLYYCDLSGTGTLGEGKYSLTGELDINCSAVEQTPNVGFEKFVLVAELNGKEINREDISEDVLNYQNYPHGVYFRHDYQMECEAKEGDELCIYLEATDSLGYLHRMLIHHWKEQNGAMAEAVDASEYIYDPNGVQIFP